MTHLPYFKFRVSAWLLGRIADQKDDVQGAFILACCFFWNKRCDYTSEDFQQKIGKKRFKKLTELEFILVKDGKIVIPFLQEEFKELSEIHAKRQKAGVARAKHMHQHPNQHMVSYIDKEVDKEVDVDIEKEFLNSSAWIEGTEMLLRVKKGTLLPLMTEFVRTKKLTTGLKSLEDTRTHFINSYKKKQFSTVEPKQTLKRYGAQQ